jgi:GntR family transcriptional regulator/MocR family aminotransferase
MLRPWKTIFNISFNAEQTLVEQIASVIMQEIIKGRLEKGASLPGSRALAQGLGVNRKTVIFAYESLIADGWAESRYKSGTFVSENLPEIRRDKVKKDQKVNTNFKFREFAPDPLTDRPLSGNLIVFNEGAPDNRLAPLKELSRAYRRILERQGKWQLLGYGAERGDLKLREMLSLLLSRDRGFYVDVNNICITRGSQMALYLAAKVLINTGEIVIVEQPGYPAIRKIFAEAGANVKSIEVDQEGLDPELLESMCRKMQIKAIYVTPHHQFPTTVTMKAGRKIRLLELSIKYGFAVIEDDYDHEYHFGAGNNLALASSDMAANVIYISSFSKLIAPAIRVGYITGPKAFMQSLVNLRIQVDRQGDNILEHAIADLMEEGIVGRHSRKASVVYRHKRDLMGSCLHQYFGSSIRFTKPEGGLAYWLEFNKEIDFDIYIQELKYKNVQIVPPGGFYADNKARTGMRLGYGSLTENELKEGIQLLADVYRSI